MHGSAILPSASLLPAKRVGRQRHSLRQNLVANSPSHLMSVEIPFGFKGV
jgi:hypothetical protein